MIELFQTIKLVILRTKNEKEKMKIMKIKKNKIKCLKKKIKEIKLIRKRLI